MEVVRLELMGDDFSDLEGMSEERFDAVIDINSRLPRLIDEKGCAFLDSIDAPFFNYILDHPLYHHPGLSVKLRNYHAIGVDECHCEYMKKHYPHLRSVSCIPMGGTKAVCDIPFDERGHDFLFSGTYLDPKLINERTLGVRRDHGEAVYQRMQALYESWDPESTTVEEVLDEPELLNKLYIVDQMKRNEERHRILSEAASTGAAITILGEGWDETPLASMDNVRILDPVPMEMSFEIMADSKYVIDPGPFFWCGMHDRVASALANGCVCISDMSDTYDTDLVDGRNIIYFGRGRTGIKDVIKMVEDLGDDRLKEISSAGTAIWEYKYSWDEHIKKLFALINS